MQYSILTIEYRYIKVQLRQRGKCTPKLKAMVPTSEPISRKATVPTSEPKLKIESEENTMANEIMIIRKEALATPALEEIRMRVDRLTKSANDATYGIAYTIGNADAVIDGNVDGISSYEEFTKVVFGMSKTQSSTYHNVAQFIDAELNELGQPVRYKDFYHENASDKWSISFLIELLPLLKTHTIAEVKQMFFDGTIDANLSVRKLRERVLEIRNPGAANAKKTGKKTIDAKSGSDVGTKTGEGTGTGTDKGTEVPTINITIPAWFVQKELVPELSRYIDDSTALKLLYGAINSAMTTPGGAITLNVNPPEEPETLEDAIKKVEGK